MGEETRKNNIKMRNTKNINILDYINRLIEGEKIISLTVYEYFKFIMQCCYGTFSKKLRLIKYAHKQISNRTDILYILNKLSEIDKLKLLFLDDNQLKLFEYMHKPLISNKLLENGEEH